MRYLFGAFLALIVFVLASPAAPGADSQVGPPAPAVEPLDDHGPDNFDARAGSVVPSGEAEAIAASIGDRVSWNKFGTAQSLIKYGGFLATGLSTDPVEAARQFVSTNRALFRLSDAGLANLEVIHDGELTGTTAHVVIFRQTFGGLAAANDGLITVAVKDGSIAYVSSSAVGDGNAPGAATISPHQALADSRRQHRAGTSSAGDQQGDRGRRLDAPLGRRVRATPARAAGRAAYPRRRRRARRTRRSSCARRAERRRRIRSSFTLRRPKS